MLQIASRDNPKFKALAKQLADNAGYRKTQQVWLEGDHLCRAALARGWHPERWVVSEDFFAQTHEPSWQALQQAVMATDAWVLSAALMRQLCTQETQARVGALVALPPVVQPAATNTLVLDRVQDAGNVGSMLRSAAAFGYTQVLAVQGTAALWSPKVLRAAMGAHFGLQLHEGLSTARAVAAAPAVLVTSSHGGQWLHQLHAPTPHAWVMGNEGQGASAQWFAAAHAQVRIAQPGGEESLNVAAAAAICLHHFAMK